MERYECAFSVIERLSSGQVHLDVALRIEHAQQYAIRRSGRLPIRQIDLAAAKAPRHFPQLGQGNEVERKGRPGSRDAGAARPAQANAPRNLAFIASEAANLNQ